MSFAPLVVFLAVALYGLLHSILASTRVKSWAQGAFGAPADRYYRLLYNLFATLSLLPVLALLAVLPDRPLYRLPLPWALIFLAVQALAGLALLIGLKQTGISSFLGFRQLVSGDDERPARLVVEGLYRRVRHPLYTAGLVFIWFLPVMTANLLALNLGLTLYIVAGARHEERRLVAEFGQVYREYQARTPMLIPRPLPSRR